MLIHVTAWHAVDVPLPAETGKDQSVCNIVAFGKRPGDSRLSVSIRATFTPFLYVRVPTEWTDSRAKSFMLDFHKFGLVAMTSGLTTRKSIWGYHSNPGRVLQLAFNSQSGMKQASFTLSRRNFEIFESSVDPVIKLLHSRDLPSVGWVEAQGATKVMDSARITSCDYEYMVPFTSLMPALDTVDRPPVVVASWVRWHLLVRVTCRTLTLCVSAGSRVLF